jgi:hypothetical protein
MPRLLALGFAVAIALASPAIAGADEDNAPAFATSALPEPGGQAGATPLCFEPPRATENAC